MMGLQLMAAESDIRDIRGPIALPPGSSLGLWCACALAAVALAVCAMVWVRRRRRARRVPVLSPYQRAKQALACVAQDAAARQPDVFAERVSSAVRQYVESRFGLPALHRTSEEFLSELLLREDLGPALRAQRPLLRSFLASCDEAKFARRGPEGGALDALHHAALAFIDAAEAAPAGVAT